MDVMNTQEAANYLRLSIPTLGRYRLAGTGPKYLKLGRNVRYMRTSLDAWMADRLVSSTSQQAAA